MNGVDLSSWQSGLDLNSISTDFAIIKATQGTDYVNGVCDRHFQQGLGKNIALGVYHFGTNKVNGARSEAEFFVNNILGYIGHAILVLDNEKLTDNAGNLLHDPHDVGWAKEFLDRVYELTGVRPLIYMSESVVHEADWSSVINGDYGLWVAKYADMDLDYGFGADKGTDFNVSWGAAGAALWQWTSRGRLDGYAGDLDLNVFYGDRSAWNAYANIKPENEQPESPVETTPPADTPEPNPVPTEPASEGEDNTPAPTTPVDEKPGDVDESKDQGAGTNAPDTEPAKLPVIPDYDTEYDKINKGYTMKLQLPAWVRVTVYIITAIGTPVVAYLLTKGVIGPTEVAFWSAEVTVAGSIAALNVTNKNGEQ